EVAEAQLVLARSLAADGRRGEAGPALGSAWKQGTPGVAAPTALLLARDRARRGNDPEAVRILDDLVRRYPQSGEAEEAAYVAARLQLDQGKEADARRRLARIAGRRSGAHASDARWTLAWLSYRRGLPDAAERFAEFTASADSDAQRAQRYDRSLALAQSLLGWKTPRPDADPALLEGAYPAAYAPQVGSSAARARVDPYLLLAVARRESLFKADTRSAAGAVGLMQLL